MNILFRLLLTFNATSLLLIIYFVNQGIGLSSLCEKSEWSTHTQAICNFCSYFIFLLIPILLTVLSIFLSSSLGKDEFKKNEINCIEYANNSFLPSYLGYFFVALSVKSYESLLFVYIVLFIFTFMSQALYFNPLFLLFGYKFYNVTNNSGAVLFLISKHTYKTPAEVKVPIAYRINNYTFIEKG